MWPNGKKVAVALTFDFDAESLFVEGEPIETITPTKLSQGEYGARVGVPRILEWLKNEELPATFFIPGVTALQYPQLVDDISRCGFEVAHHGYSHAEPFGMSPDVERADLEKGIEVLERLTGNKPVGYRAPSWAPSHITLPLLEEYGFSYDASLLADERPYVPKGMTRLLEIPSDWSLDDAPHYFFNFSPRYRAGLSTPSKVLGIWRDEFETIRDAGGSFVLAMHPQISGRGHRLKALQKFVEELRSENVWFATLEQIADHWRGQMSASAQTGEVSAPWQAK